ncbi:glycosyltransferase [Rossellomorea sp. FS2]|uniref:glycosyltransferase n=1 Tax=Rossellomorea sp. FS2 TaxID=3391447 RepID=UPI003A4DA169
MYDHFIVAPSSWEEDGLKFRRHRLVEYLTNRSDTNCIYWIYPISVHNKNQLQKYKKENKNYIKINGIKVHLISFLDLKGFIKNQSFIFNNDKNKINNILRHSIHKKKLWFTHPAYAKLIELYDWDSVIYDCSDLWARPYLSRLRSIKFLETYRSKTIMSSELEIITNSDRVITTSEYLAEHVYNLARVNAIVIENGVEYELFENTIVSSETLKEFENIPKPRIGFVGGLKHKINFRLLIDLAKNIESGSIVLAGPIPKTRPDDLDELLTMGNVYYLGPLQPTKVPEYIKEFQIGLLPYTSIEYNMAVSPLKLFEYLACGVQAIGCGIPGTTKYNEENIYRYALESEFVDACNSILEVNSSEKLIDKRKLTAKKHDWFEKFELFFKLSNENKGTRGENTIE